MELKSRRENVTMREKKAAIVLAIFIVLIGVSLYVPINANPSANTRMIVEHTYKTYIAPPCFEQAQTTNNLAETTLDKALELNYKAESSCTENHLKPVKKPAIKIIAEKMGLISGKWDW